MTTRADDPIRKAATQAARKIAELKQQERAARAALARVQDERRDDVVEANERLVLAMLAAQADVETAARALDRASRAAEIDALSGLPNRGAFLVRFTQALVDARARDQRLALLFVDLDDFRQVNDTLGHAGGDQVLRLASDRLASAAPETDMVCRYGGDEFLLLLVDADRDVASRVAGEVVAALGTPRRVADHVVRLSASVGISVFPDDGESPAALIESADAAMYREKRRARGGAVQDPDTEAGAGAERGTSLVSLQQSLSHYQLALTEHERRDTQLQEANAELVLAALNAQALQAAAEHAQGEQTAMMATVAHELRNPLGPIRSAAAVLSRVPATELPRLQALIERQVAHLSRMVGDLLDVARVQTGKLRIERRPVNLVDVIDAAVEVCRPAIDTRLQRFMVRLPSGAVPVDGDPVRLTQVFSNLIDNASKYTPQGGELAVDVAAEGGVVSVTVSDNGIGISPEALPRVFEPFVQDAHAIVFNGVGLGLGLTVVREVVEAHGGSVTASSTGPGHGSTFVVRLPMGSRAEAAGRAA